MPASEPAVIERSRAGSTIAPESDMRSWSHALAALACLLSPVASSIADVFSFRTLTVRENLPPVGAAR
jgi:hypothetical protein